MVYSLRQNYYNRLMDDTEQHFKEIAEETRERLSGQVISKGIQGKHNNLICFDDNKEDFLHRNSETIAWSALTGRLSSSNYCNFGLKGIDPENFKPLLRPFTELDFVRDYMKTGEIFNEGKKDYLVFRDGQIGYCWLPSRESTGDNRKAKNILVAQFTPEGIEIIRKRAKEKPLEIYNLLISCLYPTALVPLTDKEILDAVAEKGDDIIRIARFRDSDVADGYQRTKQQPELLISIVQPKSVLKRMTLCEQLEVIA